MSLVAVTLSEKIDAASRETPAASSFSKIEMKKRIPTASELLAKAQKVEPLVLSARKQAQLNQTTPPGRRLLLLRSRSAATELEKSVQDALWQVELAYGFVIHSLATPAGGKELEKAAMFLQSAAFKLRKVPNLLKRV